MGKSGGIVVRDSHATIKGDRTQHEFPSGGIEILASDGRALFNIYLMDDGSLDISAGNVCEHKGKVLDDRFLIKPVASNRVTLIKQEYGRK